MLENRIIGLAGRQRTGKGVLANMLSDNYGFVTVTIASALKELCCKILGCSMEELNQKKNAGEKISWKVGPETIKILSEELGGHESELKKDLEDTEFETVRDMLQILGTNVIRRLDPDWHVKKLVENIRAVDGDVVVDDVRFPNERKAIESLGGEVYYIIRPRMIDVSNHASETSLSYTEFEPDHIIINDGTIKDLEATGCDTLLDYGVANGEDASDDDHVNLRFGLDKTPIVEEVLRQNLGKPHFMEDGVIIFTPRDDHERRKAELEMFDYNHEPPAFKFVLYNPYVTENLKNYI